MDPNKMLNRISKLLILFLMLLQCFPSFADNFTVQGEVSGSWTADTVFVTGDLIVSDNNSLTISPGCNVIFNGVYEFRVEGSLQAIGLEDDSIHFTMADTTGFHIDTIAGGGWLGIRFNHTRLLNDSSVFVYCDFTYGKTVSADPATGHGGAIYINDFPKVRITKCRFTDNFATYNGGAIYADSANIIIEQSYFARNRAGLSGPPYGYGGAICSDNSNPDILWNIFEYNSSTGVGGGLAVRFKDCNVYNNVFSQNHSALGGGFGILHITDIFYRIDNNLVEGNTAEFFGGGVASLDASPYYINNTIAYNQSMYGGGFYCKDSVSPDFYNCIIWGNTAGVGPQGYLFEIYSQADFFNCDVQDGPMAFGGSGGGVAFSGAYENCIEQDPEFLGTGDYPYSLANNSPCYDAGSQDTTGFYLPEYDLAMNPRLSHAFIDIGAYEIVWVGIQSNDLQDELKVFPIPTTGKFQITSTKSQINSTFQIPKIEILDVKGKLIQTRNQEPRTRNPEFDVSSLPAGVYFVRIYFDRQVVCKKLIIQ